MKPDVCGHFGNTRCKPVILMVDDDSFNLGVLRDCLVESDYTLLAAEDGESALERVAYAKPDLILLDVMMPGIDGFETCRRIKQQADTKDIPVIFMTALAETGYKVKGLEVGGVDYITKPFQREELLARIAVHLQIRELTHRLQDANETLEKRVEERTADLAIANSELEEEIAERQAAQEQLQIQARSLEEKIEELQQAQESLKKSERKFRAIFDQTYQLMGVLNPEGILLEANRTSLDFCGVDEKDVVGLPFWETPWWTYSEQLREKLRNAISKAANGDFVRFEAPYLDAEGKQYAIDFSLKPVFDDEGRVMLLVPEGRDITAMKNLERERRQSQKMEAIGTLAAGIAHDFNNILTAINGYTEMSLWKLDDDSPVKANLNRVYEAGIRASELVKQILMFSRHSEQEMKPVSMRETVHEVLKLLRSTMPTTIEIRKEIPDSDSDCMVMADSTQLYQVLMNLGTNACHAMRANGGVLHVSLDKVDLDDSFVARHRGLKPGTYVRLTVQDTGHGMDETILDRIFDPYFTTKEVGEGTGLGLAVVSGIIREYGGAITADSQMGKGSTFRVFLPLSHNHGAIARQNDDLNPTGKERILFVDDEEPLAILGKEMLKTLGYSVTSVTESRKALNIFLADPSSFDLVITDLTMTGLTGVDLATQVKSVRSDIPIILCTGYCTGEDDGALTENSFCEFIQKPYIMNVLARTVRRTLDGGSRPLS